jgi:hypothetical protein
MSLPQIIDYNEALQDAPRAFADPALRAGNVVTTPLGLPLALSGGFALTYIVHAGQRKFAVRCFHREIHEAQSRYASISAKLRSLNSPYFVNFDFQSAGVRVKGSPYPLLKMDWVEGDTLGVYLDKIAINSAAVGSLRQQFFDLASFLAQHGIAHGDLQNENVMVSRGSLRLIDYDGMFVPAMMSGRGTEVGHKHFQHPARGAQHFGPHMDRFSFIVLDVSLEALQVQSTLHRRFREGGQTIIFRANDFADPSASEVFAELRGFPGLRDRAQNLAAICQANIDSVPTLSDFRAGRNIPTSTVRISEHPAKPAQPAAYIAAYPVVDGRSFANAFGHVGDKVELVGQIVSVKHGVGKRGRGRGRPYVFINFGPWNQESVKITIWSEGLGNMNAPPNESWVGRWISVIGLVEPPYEGRHYGRSYRNVGVTVDSDKQIVQVSAKDAAFRLKAPGALRSRMATTRSNADVLSSLKNGPQRGVSTPGQQRPPSRGAPPASHNQQVLQSIRRTGVSPPQQAAPSPIELLTRIPLWVWVLVGLIAFFQLF